MKENNLSFKYRMGMAAGMTEDEISKLSEECFLEIMAAIEKVCKKHGRKGFTITEAYVLYPYVGKRIIDLATENNKKRGLPKPLCDPVMAVRMLSYGLMEQVNPDITEQLADNGVVII